jgi:hypothetical protein
MSRRRAQASTVVTVALIGITFLTLVERGRAEKVHAAPKDALRSDLLVVEWTDDQVGRHAIRVEASE